jgi:hypothetical protein
VRLGNVCLCGLARCVHSGDCRPMLTALSDSAVVQVGECVLSRDVLKVSRMNARPGWDGGGGGFVEGHRLANQSAASSSRLAASCFS